MIKKKFAIIDIETTGGSARRDKITEIAIILHDGHEILDTWQSLINPERSIPHYITNITGINDQMVQHAPKFYEIAKELVEWTEECIFVAHNVRFDYSFIAEEFRSLGYTYSKQQLCTVQMSRKAFPGLKSYSLGNLVKHFQIPLPNHHRAMDDAMATSELFRKIVQSPYYQRVNPILSRNSIKEQKLPAHIDMAYLQSIPNAPGLYYFLNEQRQIIYIGKSKNLRKRIYDHFSDKTERSARLQAAVFHIDYQLTGNELAALLLESYEIKKHKPVFNKAQKQRYFTHAIYYQKEHSGTLQQFQIGKSESAIKGEILRWAKSKEAATLTLQHHLSNAGLCECQRNNKIEEVCLFHKMGVCRVEGIELTLQEKLELAFQSIKKGFEEDGIYVGPGRNEEEHFVILIKNLHFFGMGYISKEETVTSLETFESIIDEYPINAEIPGIIHTYLKDHIEFQFKSLKNSAGN